MLDNDPPFRGIPHVSPHALAELRRRGLDASLVRSIVENPGQWFYVRPGRIVLQSIVEASGQLVRVFVDVDREPPEIVTCYRTSKITKYWRDS